MASRTGQGGRRLYVEIERCLPPQDGDPPTGIVRAHGEVDLETAHELGDTLDPSLWEGCSGVLVDLTDVRFMDSTGLSVLVVADKSFGEVGIRLAIATEPRSQIEGLLELTGLRLRIPDSL
jgi:anti-sigma B factor antagonist